ncbi:hypothetical protein D3C81_2085950 [compost metagenome]
METDGAGHLPIAVPGCFFHRAVVVGTVVRPWHALQLTAHGALLTIVITLLVTPLGVATPDLLALAVLRVVDGLRVGGC